MTVTPVRPRDDNSDPPPEGQGQRDDGSEDEEFVDDKTIASPTSVAENADDIAIHEQIQQDLEEGLFGKDDAKYVTFAFDGEMDTALVSKYEIDLVK